MPINREDWLRSVVPAGTVIAFAGTTPPTGWLLCNGSAISRTTYSALFAAIGSAHGSGDGSTTFHLPDYRGRFLRGVANGSANDPDRANRTHPVTGAIVGDVMGSVQADAMQGHKHEYPGSDGGGSGAGIAGVGYALGRNNRSYTWPTDATPASDGTNGSPRTSSESRPKNANVNYIIKV